MEGRLIAVAGCTLIFILVAIPRTFSSSNPLFWSSSLFIPLAVTLAGLLVYLVSPAPSLGKIELWEIVAVSSLLAAGIISRPRDSSLLIFYGLILLWGAVLIIYGVSESGWNLLKSRPLVATYINRNHFCAFIGMILPLTVSFGIGSPKRSVAWLSRIGFLILLSGIILTRSRGGLLAGFISTLAVLLIYILSRGKKKHLLLLLICVLLILLIGAAIYTNYRTQPVYATSLDALSIQTRFSIWESGAKMFLARPWLGWGWGTFKYVYPQFKSEQVWYGVPHAHNEWLQILAEGGAVGFLVFTGCFLLVFIRLIRTGLTSGRTIGGLFSLGSAGSLLYTGIHGGFDFILRLPANISLITIIVSLGLALTCSGKRVIKPVVSISIILLLGIFILYPAGRFYRSYLQWEEGERQFEAGNSSAALRNFDRASALDPDFNPPLYRKADIRMGQFEASPDKIRSYRMIVDDLMRAHRNNPWDLQPLWTLGNFYRKLHAYQDAAAVLEKVLVLDPNNPFLLYDLARIELLSGKLRAGALRLRRSSSIYPSMWPACRDLLFLYTDDYDILRELPSDRDSDHRNLGYHLLGDERWDPTEMEFRKAVSLAPGNPNNYRALGVLFSRTGDYAQSEKFYHRAIELSPENAQWLYELGRVWRNLDNNEKALDFYLRAYNLAPDKRSYTESAGALILQLKGPEAALGFWEEVMNHDQLLHRPHYHRARLFLKAGDLSQAKKEIDRALELVPGNRDYLSLQKRIHKKKSQITSTK